MLFVQNSTKILQLAIDPLGRPTVMPVVARPSVPTIENLPKQKTVSSKNNYDCESGRRDHCSCLPCSWLGWQSDQLLLLGLHDD